MSWSGKCVSQRPGGMRSPAPLYPALCRRAGEPFQSVLPGQVPTDHLPAVPAGLCGSFGDSRGAADCQSIAVFGFDPLRAPNVHLLR